MAALDLAAWCSAALQGAPAGPDLESDADFDALDRAARGRPERQSGETVIAAEEPNWREVEASASALLERSIDLRLLRHLGVARLHVAGLAGFAATLAAISDTLSARWQDIHPALDPEDNNDPTPRATALEGLAHPAWVLKYLRDMPLASARGLGECSWRNIPHRDDMLPGGYAGNKTSEADIRALFANSDHAGVTELRDAARQAASHAKKVVATFDKLVGTRQVEIRYVDVLTKLLNEIADDVDRFAVLDETGDALLADEPRPGAVASDASDAATSARLQAGSPRSAMPVEVASRADALRLLDVACQYYRRYEPSSPLPLLIERARRLADKDFIEILRDMAPDGLAQAQNVVGVRDE
jgi:type VI secretion system protein ImpA